jgi:hypothetical protein
MITWISSLSPDEMSEINIKISNETTVNSVEDWTNFSKFASQPILDWSQKLLYDKSYVNCK